MANIQAQTINLISLVDRPGHEEVVELAKHAYRLPKIVRPLAAMAITAFLVGVLGGLGARALPIAFAVGIATALVGFLDDTVMLAAERNRAGVALSFGGIGLFVGVACAFVAQKELWLVAAVGVASFCGAWVFGHLGLALATLAVTLLNNVLKVLASPLAVPILAIAAARNRSALQRGHPTWVTSRGRPIVEFDRDGVKYIHHDGDAMFLPSSRLRAAGTAVPRFKLTELYNTSLVNARMGEAFQDLEAGGAVDLHGDMAEQLVVNPATMLPMIGGMGGVDSMGNQFGFDNQHGGVHES
ncbi:hypothetical protein ACG02S_00945 [Roseateles sp. DC23W]|uniref:Uncharacterized protein n=1 Tax=Pelomonas dachongensis TaxID=3299029 RepID=A0ABW7EH08_9BURK